MRKALLGTTAIVGATLLAPGTGAAKPTLTIGGAMDFQVGWTSQDREGWTPTPGGVQGPKTERGFDFFQRTEILFRASDTTDSGMKWDFRVDLNADPDSGPGGTTGISATGRDNANVATLTLSDAWGSIVVGADHPVQHKYEIHGGTAVGKAGTGGVDGDWARWFNNETVTSRFETGATAHDATTASLISYLSPRVAGFRGAFTYQPSHHTLGRFREPTSGVTDETDWYEGIVDWYGKVGDFDLGASISGQENSNTNPLSRNGEVWQFGAIAGYQHFKVSGSYVDKVRDGETLSTDTNTGFNMWDVGVGYEIGPVSLGVSYMRQNAGHIDSTGTDSQNLYVFSTTYDMGAGLQLYGELFHIEDKAGSPAVNAAKSNNTGTGLISGVRVKF